MKGTTMPRLDPATGSPSSPRAKIDAAALKDQSRSTSSAPFKAASSPETRIHAITPRSPFPVTCALIVDAPSQTVLSAEGLQALGSSIAAISSCSTYAAALSTAEHQLRILMMQSVLLVSSRAIPHVISCVVSEGVVECATSSRVYRACDRVDAFVVVGGEAVALQCCSAARYPTHQAFSAAVILKNFGTIHVAEFKWMPSGCEVALLEAFIMQVAPLLHFMRLSVAKAPLPAPSDSISSIVASVQDQTLVSAVKSKLKRGEPVAVAAASNVSSDESELHSRTHAIDSKPLSNSPEISLVQAILAAMGDLAIHCHGAFLPYDNILRCFVLDPRLLVLPGNNRPSFTPKFIEDSRLNMSKQLLPADMYPFSEPMLQHQLLYVPDATHEASVQRALSDVHAGSTVTSQNIIISSMFQSLYGSGSLIACGFWSDDHSSDNKSGSDAGYKGTFVLWAERQRTIPQHLCAVVDSICQRASASIFHFQKQSFQATKDSISASVASATVALVGIRTSFSKRLVHIVQETLPSIFGGINQNCMLDTTHAFAVWIPAPQVLSEGFAEISELQLVACLLDGKIIEETMDRPKLENYPVLLHAWARGGIVCIDGRGSYGYSDASGTISRTREIFCVPQDRIMCETAIATAQLAGSDFVLAAVQIVGCQRAQGYTESELRALSQVAQMLGGYVLQEQENVMKQKVQLKSNRMVTSFSRLLSTASQSLGKITFDALNLSDIEKLSLCEENILKSFPLRSVRSQLKSMLMQVNARSAAFILVDLNESSVVLILQVTAGAAYSDSDRHPKKCSLESRSGLVYKCIKTRKPVVYSAENQEPLDAHVDHLARDKFTTCLLVPILLENRVVAVIQVFSKLRGEGQKLGKDAFVSCDSVKAVDSSVLSAALQRSRHHMHMLRSGRADLMALERLPVVEAHPSSKMSGSFSPSWRAELGSPVFESDDVDIVVAASEACGQMVSLAFRACHSVRVASNMSRFSHLIQVNDSGKTLSEYACKVIVELLSSSISPRSGCLCSVFLLQQASKSKEDALIHMSTFFEGEAPQNRISEKDIELVRHIVSRQIDSSSLIVCCPIHDSLVKVSMGDPENMGVMVVQMPTSCLKMSDAEIDAMKVVCQHLAEALKNSSALVRTSKEEAKKQQYAAIEFLGNCVGCPDVNSMMTSICKELHSFIQFDCAAAFTVKLLKPESNSALRIEREWMMSCYPDDMNRLSAQSGILRVLGREVLINASTIGPLVVDGPESAGNMFAQYHLARAEHSTKVSKSFGYLPKTWIGQPISGCIFGVPLSTLQDDGSLRVCGSLVLVRDGHEKFFEHNDVQLIQSIMFKLAKVLVKLL